MKIKLVAYCIYFKSPLLINFMQKVKMSKLPHVGTTIFTTMSHLALKHGAINLSQGFPNFPVDPLLIELTAKEAAKEVHQYMPMGGAPQLLDRIEKLVQDTYSRPLNASKEILITAGATQAIFTAILALIQSGDEVIILDPSYDCYEPAVILAGGIPVRIPLSSSFTPDWDKIESTVSGKTKMIITNNPHNPSGRIWSEQDIASLVDLLEQNPNMLVLSDEVYEHISFEHKHISINEQKSLWNRSIIVSSFGKTFHITGWKIGYLVASEELMNEIKKVHQFNVFSVNSLGQSVLASYLENIDVSSLHSFYKKKRDLFQSLLIKSNFKLLHCEGTYFQTADYSNISKENDVAFCESLILDHGVAAIPISVFSKDKKDQNIIRFCFAKDEQTLISATQKLCRI